MALRVVMIYHSIFGWDSSFSVCSTLDHLSSSFYCFNRAFVYNVVTKGTRGISEVYVNKYCSIKTSTPETGEVGTPIQLL